MQKRLHKHDGADCRGREKSAAIALKSGSRLLVETSWLFNQFEASLVKNSMELLGLGATAKKRIMGNMTDDTWLKYENNGLAHKMMKNRIPVLEEMYLQFCGLAGVLGWDRTITNSMADTIMPFMDIGERTCYTYYGHNYRSMQYAEMLLDYRGVGAAEKAEIMLGTLLHDTGKAGVPGGILRKEGRPNLVEGKYIEKHTVYGRDILTGAARLHAPPRSLIRAQMGRIADIALSHQEKFCGKGYPRQKAGADICIGARIAAFCDALDAMTSKRLYQKGMPKTFAQARGIALIEMNVHFNENIVTDFFKAVDKVHGLKDRIYAIISGCGGNPE
ncbi:MAG: HD domain-containing protein [Candidatus ainarchaeum sp.]|nr:HD domain-containing protein [Candidatus ainarchaeum sp.]